ncbi:hypothetical protein H671_8g19368 [Cricetulus griseus]|uniref:Uncharacterized protein n=1 Tax=Cricetulus griseus TaxID=10029 RepID=A0A061HVY5_CRIGR|nr:hypothetical protein H671_8g19368 [Cricetulus griseus]
MESIHCGIRQNSKNIITLSFEIKMQFWFYFTDFLVRYKRIQLRQAIPDGKNPIIAVKVALCYSFLQVKANCEMRCFLSTSGLYWLNFGETEDIGIQCGQEDLTTNSRVYSSLTLKPEFKYNLQMFEVAQYNCDHLELVPLCPLLPLPSLPPPLIYSSDKVLAITNNAAMNVVEQMFLLYECAFFGYMPKRGMAGS